MVFLLLFCRQLAILDLNTLIPILKKVFYNNAYLVTPFLAKKNQRKRYCNCHRVEGRNKHARG